MDDIKYLKEEFLEEVNNNSYDKLIISTLVGGFVGALFFKLMGSMFGLIVGFFIGLYKNKKRIIKIKKRIGVL